MRRLLPTLLLLIASCSTLTTDIHVRSATDADADRKAWRSYSWDVAGGMIADSTGTWSNPGFDMNAEVRFLVDQQLRSAGLDEQVEGANLTVSAMLLADRTMIEKAGEAQGGAADRALLTQGALLVELIDAGTGRVVWRAAAEAATETLYSPAETKQRLAYAVREMFKRFPR